jgi:hypothetical protein
VFRVFVQSHNHAQHVNLATQAHQDCPVRASSETPVIGRRLTGTLACCFGVVCVVARLFSPRSSGEQGTGSMVHYPSMSKMISASSPGPTQAHWVPAITFPI